MRSIRSNAATTAPSGAPSAGADGREPDIGAPSGGRPVDGAAQSRERPLAAGRRGLDRLAAGRVAAVVARRPGRDVEARVGHPVGQLAPDRDLDPDQVDARRRSARRPRAAPPRCRARGGSRRATAAAPRRACRCVSRRTVRWASMRSIAAAARPGRLDLGDRAPVVLAQQLALERRGRSRPTRRRAPAAVARGRIRGAPSRTAGRSRSSEPRGSPASQRSTAAPASGRPAASSPVTPNRRRIARSWPIVVDARARAPQAPASASARATRRSIGPQSFVIWCGRRPAASTRGPSTGLGRDPPRGSSRASMPSRRARHGLVTPRSSSIDALARRFPARNPR